MQEVTMIVLNIGVRGAYFSLILRIRSKQDKDSGMYIYFRLATD
jgi:hypothetical protein